MRFAALLAIFVAGGSFSAPAQVFRSYRCEDGTQFVAMTMPDSRAAYLQLDGKSLKLTRSVAYAGTRYAKGGVSFWIRGDRVTLNRRGEKRTVCRAI